MTGPASARAAILLTAAAMMLAACSRDGQGLGPAAGQSAVSPASASPTPAPPRATPPPRPREGACYRLTYEQALAPTTHARARSCATPHTAVTYLVGTIDALVDGHLLAVDSGRVQAQVAADCPDRLGEFLHATPAQLRLTALRPVWFTPTLAQSDKGHDWYRCDVIALAGPEQLAPLERTLEGALATPEGRDRFGSCGTTQPGLQGFEQVICSRPHGWRAISSYDVPGGRDPGAPYPGENLVRQAAEKHCQAAAQAVAADTLDYQWGYDWPTADQWAAGQHYGLCWAPDLA